MDQNRAWEQHVFIFEKIKTKKICHSIAAIQTKSKKSRSFQFFEKNNESSKKKNRWNRLLSIFWPKGEWEQYGLLLKNSPKNSHESTVFLEKNQKVQNLPFFTQKNHESSLTILKLFWKKITKMGMITVRVFSRKVRQN